MALEESAVSELLDAFRVREGTDPIGDRVTGEREDGRITGEPDIDEPDLAAFRRRDTPSQSVSSSGHASFGHGTASAALSGQAAYRSASGSQRSR